MSDTGWMVGAWLFLSYPKRVLGVEVEHAVVFDIDLWNPIISGGKQKAIVKPDLAGPGLEFLIPLRSYAGAS